MASMAFFNQLSALLFFFSLLCVPLAIRLVVALADLPDKDLRDSAFSEAEALRLVAGILSILRIVSMLILAVFRRFSSSCFVGGDVSPISCCARECEMARSDSRSAKKSDVEVRGLIKNVD